MMDWKSLLESLEMKERELNKRHEDILAKREALLRGTEAFFNTNKDDVESLLTDFRQARDRNEKLLQELNNTVATMKDVEDRLQASNFSTLRSNYYSMVAQVFPVWYTEQQDYDLRNRGRTPSRSRSRSPHIQSAQRPLLTRYSRSPSPSDTIDWSQEDTFRSLSDVPRTNRSSDDTLSSRTVLDVRQTDETTSAKGAKGTHTPRQKRRRRVKTSEVVADIHAADDMSTPVPALRQKNQRRVTYARDDP